MHFVLVAALIAPFFLFLPGSLAHALSVSPMYVELRSLGRGARSVVTLQNDRNRDIVIDVGIDRLVIDDKGNIVERIAQEDDFLVFPPSARVAPLSSQTFRIIWTGDPEIDQSDLYAITFTKIAPESEATPDVLSVQVNFNYAFSVVTAITPHTGEPSIAVDTVDIVRSDRGDPVARTVLTNSSNVHGTLATAGFFLTLRDAANDTIWSQRLDESAVIRSVGLGIVMPFTSREIDIALKEIVSDPDILSKVRSATVEVR